MRLEARPSVELMRRGAAAIDLSALNRINAQVSYKMRSLRDVPMKPVRLHLQRHRLRAMVALALLVFAQLSLAASGCFATRTGTVDVGSENEGCPIERLLCWTHCQANEQTLDPASTLVWSVDSLLVWPSPLFVALLESRSAMRSRLNSYLATPPPTILLERMLN